MTGAIDRVFRNAVPWRKVTRHEVVPAAMHTKRYVRRQATRRRTKTLWRKGIGNISNKAMLSDVDPNSRFLPVAAVADVAASRSHHYEAHSSDNLPLWVHVQQRSRIGGGQRSQSSKRCLSFLVLLAFMVCNVAIAGCIASVCSSFRNKNFPTMLLVNASIQLQMHQELFGNGAMR